MSDGRPYDQDCDQSSSQWGPLPPNEIGRFAQQAREGEGWKEKSKGLGGIIYFKSS
jgi:hypothetical protein